MIASRVRDGALIIAALVVAAAAYHFRPAAKPHLIQAGKPLGRLSFTTLDGSAIALAPQPGRTLLVNVFATWCPPCRSETPALADAAPRLKRAGIDVVGIDQSESGPQVQRFAQEFDLHYPLYIDDNDSTKYSLGARIIPTTVIVDSHGVVRFVHVGPLDMSEFLSLAAGASK
jgi:thiol-disulfide isomerase/thioredoxin